MKKSKKIMAILAAAAILSGGGSLFPCTEVRAAVDTAKVLQQVLTEGNTNSLNTEEKTWYDGFFGGTTLTNKDKTWIDTMSKKIQTQDDWIITGNDNIPYYSGGTEIVYGSSNSYYSQSIALGHQNDSLGKESLAVGRGNAALGREGVAIGTNSVAGPYEARLDKSSAVAIGERAYASGLGLAFGGYSVAMGTRGIALGYEAQAGIPAIAHMWDDYAYDSDPIYKDLIEHNPDIFGKYEDLKGKTPGETNANAQAKVEPMVFDHYKDYFSSIGIGSLEKLLEKSNGRYLLRKLAYQMVYTKDNVNYPIAIGTQAHAYSNKAVALGTASEVLSDNGVALGASSRVEKEDLVSDGTKGEFSNIVLSTKGTEVNGINEYLLGPVSIGGKKADDATAVYLRQLKYVADGTADTDAVNVRQLKAALKNGGNSGGGDNGGSGNTGSSIVYEAGDNITITDGKNDHTKVISATGITEMKEKVNTLNERVDGMTGRISRLDDRVDKVGAGAAALAALHPLDYDPDDKLDVAAGYGHYAGASAVALGAYYRPNEDIMFSIGGSFGNGEKMMNAGVSVKVGSGKSTATTSKAAMAKKINELQQVTVSQQQQLKEQKDYMAKQDERMARQEEEIQKLKEIIEKMGK